jgi:glutathione S-transferase
LALAEEAAIDIAAYPAIAAWRERIRQLPGYVPPGP